MLRTLRMRLHPTTKTPSILLCVDFDETITQRDTISLLFQLATSSASVQQQLVTQYVDDVSALLSGYETKWQHQGITNRRFDHVGLREFLKGYAAADLRSLQRVIDCRALRGIQHHELVKVARNVQLRPNCAETLAIVDEWSVVSTNWSKELVASVLTQAGVAREMTQIIANDMKVDDQGVTTGEIDLKVQSPMDKATWVAKIRTMHADTCVMYVGDSATDLLALLAADVGVCFFPDTVMSSAMLLRQLVENYGVDVHPLVSCSSLDDCLVKASDASNGKPVLFTMTDWAQLNGIFAERLRN